MWDLTLKYSTLLGLYKVLRKRNCVKGNKVVTLINKNVPSHDFYLFLQRNLPFLSIWPTEHEDTSTNFSTTYCSVRVHLPIIKWSNKLSTVYSWGLNNKVLLGSEIRTSLHFEWSKRGWHAHGPNFEWDLKSWSTTIWNLDKWVLFLSKTIWNLDKKCPVFWMV